MSNSITSGIRNDDSLHSDGSEDEPLLRVDDTASNDLRSARVNTKPSLDKIVFYFMMIHFLLAFCQIVLVAPLIRLFENSLCLSYYDFPVGGVQESMCKIPQIQGPLATIRGWKSSLDTIPVLLVAIPLGRLGDVWGRRRILALSLIGVAFSLFEIFIICAFPHVFSLRLVWLSSLFLLCGGGLNSASAFMWAMAAENIPTERRSHSFYYIFSAFYVAELIASFVASVTMSISPWLPAFMALGALLLCLILLLVMPVLEKIDRSEAQTSDAESSPTMNREPTKQSLMSNLVAAAAIPNVLLVIPVFLVGIFRYTTLDVLIQYASNRFGIKLSTGSMFYTETAGINIALFLFLVPQTTAYIRKEYNVRPQVMDLVLVRTSVILMCLGSLAIALAPSAKALPYGVAVFAAGFGSRVSALSLISYWIADEAKATLYATITVLESVGHAIGDPAMQQIFAASLTLPPFWLALPFFFAACLYFIAVMTTSFVILEPMPRPHEH